MNFRSRRPFLLALSFAVTGCVLWRDDGAQEPIVPYRIEITSPAAYGQESIPRGYQVRVTDSSGRLAQDFQGTLSVIADVGPITPGTIAVVDGEGLGTFTLEVGGYNGITVTGPSFNLLPAHQPSYVLTNTPARVAGIGVSGEVLGTGSGWDSAGAWAPSVLVDSVSYRMWYASSALASGTNGNIGLAESTDALVWTRNGAAPQVGPAAVPSTCHTDGADRPSVFKALDGSYVMLYQGTVSGRRHLCRAVSTDGLAWTPVPGSLTDGAVLEKGAQGSFDDEAITGAAVIRLDNGSLAAIFAGEGLIDVTANHAGDETVSGFGLATSNSNGAIWTKVTAATPGGALLLSYEETEFTEEFDSARQYGASLLKQGSVFRLWVSGFSGEKRIGYHATTDVSYLPPAVPGSNPDNLAGEILEHGTGGNFDDGGVELPCVVVGVDGVKRMYYTGTKLSDGRRRIGVAQF